MRCFREWPFVYFTGGFISHLFGDYANTNMWKSDYKKDWNSIKNDCGRFVKKQKISGTGKEYLTIVQMIVKDEGYWYFFARAKSDAWLCPPSPSSTPQTHTHHQKGHCLPNDLCPSQLQPTQPFFQFPLRQIHNFCSSHNCSKIKQNLFQKS